MWQGKTKKSIYLTRSSVSSSCWCWSSDLGLLPCKSLADLGPHASRVCDHCALHGSKMLLSKREHFTCIGTELKMRIWFGVLEGIWAMVFISIIFSSFMEYYNLVSTVITLSKYPHVENKKYWYELSYRIESVGQFWLRCVEPKYLFILLRVTSWK